MPKSPEWLVALCLLLGPVACADKAPPARFRDPPPPTLAQPLPPDQASPEGSDRETLDEPESAGPGAAHEGSSPPSSSDFPPRAETRGGGK